MAVIGKRKTTDGFKGILRPLNNSKTK